MVTIHVKKFVGRTGTLYYDEDYTPHVVKISKIHDVLELDSSGFQFNAFSFEVYDPGWIYSDYMAFRGENMYVDVRYNGESIFFGRIKTNQPIRDTRTGSLKFECEHAMADLGNMVAASKDYKYYTVITARSPIGIVISSFEAAPLFGSNGVFETSMYAGQRFVYELSALSTGIDTVSLPSVMIKRTMIEERIDRLTLFGKLLRSLGLMFYWRDNVIHVINRNTIAQNNQDVIVLNENQVIGMDELKAWDLMASGVVLDTVDIDGNSVELSGGQVRRSFYRRDDINSYSTPVASTTDRVRGKSIKTIEAPYLGGLFEATGNGRYRAVYDVLKEYILDSYATWYCRNAQQINFRLEGLNWWIGQTISIPRIDQVFSIQETYKDIEDMSTEVVAVSINETPLTGLA